MKRIFEKVAKDIMENKAKILDDFSKFYLASFDDKHFLKLRKEEFKRIELVEKIISPTEYVYSFRLKRGRLPKFIKK